MRAVFRMNGWLFGALRSKLGYILSMDSSYLEVNVRGRDAAFGVVDTPIGVGVESV